MELVKNGLSEITIKGNIKTNDDYLEIKKMISSMLEAGSKQLTIILLDSISMTSSVIGFLVKLILHDKVQITTQISDYRLYDLLQELNLTDLFRARHTGNKGYKKTPQQAEIKTSTATIGMTVSIKENSLKFRA